MNPFIRINALVNKAMAGNPDLNSKNILKLLEDSPKADITVMPSLSLMPPASQKLFGQKNLVDKCKVNLAKILETAKQKTGYFICGFPCIDCGKTVSAIAVCCDGKLLGLIPDFCDYDNLQGNFSSQFLPFDSVFQCGDLRFAVASCNSDNMLSTAAMLSRSGCNLMIFTCYYPVVAGSQQAVFDTAKVISKQFNVAVTVVNGGVGDTSSPFVYEGMVCAFENGESIVLKESGDKPISAVFDLDSEIAAGSNTLGNNESCFYAEPMQKDCLLRNIEKNPFVPSDDYSKNIYLDELFELQVNSLYRRVMNTGIKHAVLGVSGGLDSTLALMVAACAFDKAGIPRENLWCITMPGFGTSDRTYYNALGLMEALGVTKEDISIRASVLQHFEDIGHNPDEKNVTYENAQARERTQILFDISNEINGFVIGTGDLSESALGWCTFGGDAIASFNVNICIPKTVIRQIVARLVDNSVIEGTESFLTDVLQTPVSPELLPSDENGEISQKTEEILGSYDLHDFFIYYTVKYGFSPEKLFLYACCAFKEQFSASEIKTRLIVFIKRFYRSQFKRTCAPDCADITEVNLSNGNYLIPCDMNIDDLVSQAQALELN